VGHPRLHPEKDEVGNNPEFDFGGQARLHPQEDEIKYFLILKNPDPSLAGRDFDFRALWIS